MSCIRRWFLFMDMQVCHVNIYIRHFSCTAFNSSVNDIFHVIFGKIVFANQVQLGFGCRISPHSPKTRGVYFSGLRQTLFVLVGKVSLFCINVHMLRVIAIDMLGFGRSSRPHITSLPSADAAGAEQWWVDSIELWRQVWLKLIWRFIWLGIFYTTRASWVAFVSRTFNSQHFLQAVHIESMSLLGHSLGGYLAACYAMRYPQRLYRLILASPAGVIVLSFRTTSHIIPMFDFWWCLFQRTGVPAAELVSAAEQQRRSMEMHWVRRTLRPLLAWVSRRLVFLFALSSFQNDIFCH